MNFDIEKAAANLRKNAEATSLGKCARAVRMAIQAGGINPTSWPPVAKDYARYLLDWGFLPLEDVSSDTADQYRPILGDIVVLQPVNETEAGHIAMFDGAVWISDFRQRDIWAGPSFRHVRPPIAAFRYPVAPVA
jgi:hypothetical protein